MIALVNLLKFARFTSEECSAGTPPSGCDQLHIFEMRGYANHAWWYISAVFYLSHANHMSSVGYLGGKSNIKMSYHIQDILCCL